jgi:hypothetical protein
MSRKKADLSKLIPKSKDVEITKQASSNISINQAELLLGYEVVEPENWDKIPYRSHIRYLRTNGEFKKGGYVMAITHTDDLDGKDTIKIDLKSGFIPSAITWSIYKGNISKIWKKIDDNTGNSSTNTNNSVNVTLLLNKVNDLEETINNIRISINQLGIDYQNMNQTQIRTIQKIKKLHNL